MNDKNSDRSEGFYRVMGKIYYGEYRKEQVSGRMRLSVVKPERFGTDAPYGSDDEAVLFKENHALTGQELDALESGLDKITRSLGDGKTEDIDFSEAEKRLGVTIPEELKILYAHLNRPEYFSDSERFLPLDELYIDEGNLVFYKIKRKPAGISLSDGTFMSYFKKQWIYYEGGESFLCYALNRVVVKSILLMPFIRKGKIKGALRTALRPQIKLTEIYGDKFSVLEEYDDYGNIVLYNEDGALGWFRQNGLYADIIIGCRSAELLDMQTSVLTDAEWEG